MLDPKLIHVRLFKYLFNACGCSFPILGVMVAIRYFIEPHTYRSSVLLVISHPLCIWGAGLAIPELLVLVEQRLIIDSICLVLDVCCRVH